MPEENPGPCRYCKILLGQLSAIVKQRGELDEFEAWTALRSHVARKHPAQVPGHTEDCPSCLQWKALLPHARPTTRALLTAEDALHRAGHLIVTQRPGPGVLQVGLATFGEGGATLWAT